MSRAKTRKHAGGADRASAPRPDPLTLALAICGAIGVGLLIYGPALKGEFISDDLH